MELQVISPEKVLYQGEVESVTLTGKDGEFQILNMHAPIVSSLDKGPLRVKANEKASIIDASFSEANNEFIVQLNGGVMEMNNNTIIVLAD